MRYFAIFLCICVLTVLSLATSPATAQTSRQDKPNVIIVITDDQGYGDLGCHGNTQIRTPNIDTFYDESTRFTRFYVSPVCSPTRASVMTGRYNYRTGVVGTYGAKGMMESSEITIAECLRDAGYATGLFGKWHLGDHWPMRPTDQGFQEVLCHQGGSIGHWSIPTRNYPPHNTYFDPVLQRNNSWVISTGYCTDIFFDAAIDFIEANRSQPFFAYIATNAPHIPEQIDEQYVEPYREMGLDNFTARIYGMCENIDDNMGRLLGTLDELSLRENTILIFMTDNGPQLYERIGGENNRPRYSAGMRGAKTTVWENGLRVPYFIRWPARWQGDRDISRIAAHIDIMPTLLDICGIDLPDDRVIDGVSLLPLLDNRTDTEAQWPERQLFIQGHHANTPTLNRNIAVVGQRYKLVQPRAYNGKYVGNEPFMLFDLEKDPGEHQDLAADEPDLCQRMKRAYEQWFEDVSSTRGYHPVRIPIGTAHQERITLLQQTWRSFDNDTQGRPGAWVVSIEKSGTYQFTAQFLQTSQSGTVWLKAGNQERSMDVTPMAMSCTFEPIQLESGDCEIESYFISNGKRKKMDYVHIKEIYE